MSKVESSGLDLVKRWQRAKVAAAKAQETEMTLRREIGASMFPDPREGVNSFDLPDGTVVKYDHKLNYSLDKAVVDGVLDRLADENQVDVEKLVHWSPSLSLTYYRTLDDAALLVLSEALTVKPGTPAVSIVPPKKKEPKGGAIKSGVRGKAPTRH